MPDFNKDLSPVIKEVDRPELDYTSTSPAPSPNLYTPSSFGSKDESAFDILREGSIRSNPVEPGIFVTDEEMMANRKYKTFNPLIPDYEDFAAHGQSIGEKLVNGLGKGIALTGTTFLQTTVGAINGIAKWVQDSKFSSFYDNDFNRALDKFNKDLENSLPHYYTEEEKNAPWYSPSHFFTANFLWDGIVKNLGFSAGAALSGLVFAGALRAFSMLPKVSRLVSMGKIAEAVAKSEGVAIGEGSVLAKTVGVLEKANRGVLSSYRLLSPAQRAVVAGLSTSGEAGIEAYNNRKQFIDEKVAEYEERYQTKPYGKAMDDIIAEADEVGRWSYYANMGLLSITNYIQFPKILGSSYKIEKATVNGVTREIHDVVREAGKYVRKPVAHKLLHKINKIRPYTFSASEAFEEGSQYVIQTGTQNFYDKKYKGEEADALSSVLEGVKKTLTTTEGMDNLIIGGLSGALMLGVGKYKEANRKTRATQDAITAFNKKNLSDFAKDTYDSVKRGVVLQTERLAAIVNGDQQESKDLEEDYIINYAVPRIKYGRYDLVKADIDDLKREASTEEGFSQLKKEGKVLEGDTREAYLSRISSFEKTFDKVNLLYQSLTIRYGGEFVKDNKGNKSPKYPIDKMIYAASKIADYDERIASLLPKLLHSDLIKEGIDINEIISEVTEGKYEKFNQAADAIKALKDIEKDEIGQALDDIVEMSLRRNTFFKEYEEMKTSPEKWTKKEKEVLTPEELEKLTKEQEEGEEEQIVELETAKGKRKATVGKTYFLGSVVDYDKNGLEKPIESIEFKIVKDNGETIDIINSKGELKTVSKSVFKNYNVSGLDALKDDDNANYFYHHRNEKFEFNFGKDKDGNPKLLPGRIEYKDGKLFFVYKKYVDKKGKAVLGRIEVSREQFFAQEGFKQAMIKMIGTVENKEQREARERLTDEKKRKEENKKLEESTRARNNLLTELFVDLSERQKNITELIAKKKAELKNINTELQLLKEDMEGLYVGFISTNKKSLDVKHGKIQFRKHAKKYLDASIRLSKMKEDIEWEIGNLEARKNDLEIAIAYVEDVAHYSYELSPDVESFTNEIENQLLALRVTVEKNNLQINKLQKFLSSIEKAIDSVVSMLHSLVSEFEKTYPKAPTAILGQEWVDFIQANPNFLTLKPAYKEDLKTLENIIAETEEFELKPNEKKAQEAREEIEALEKEIKEVESEIIGMSAILKKFEPYRDKAQKQKLEEEKLSKDNKSAEKEMNSKRAGTRNADLNNYDKEYEPDPKKNDKLVATSTIVHYEGKAHQTRANLFGFNFSNFKNKDKIRGVYITSKNEHLLIPGLTAQLYPKEEGETDEQAKEKQDTVIALVMVEWNEKTGTYTPVDVNGNALAEGVDPLENGIYQVFPLSKLTWDNGESMFRKTTPDEVQESIRQQYKEWRNKVLKDTEEMKDSESNEDLMAVAHDVNVSFGIPNYVRKDNNDIDYSTRTSVEEAGLVDENDMKNNIVLEIPTTKETIENGSVRFTNALGRVFVKLKNGYAKLHNRQLNQKEATAVYKVIHRLSQLMMDEKGIGTKEAQRLLEYLRSVVFWRLPEKGEPDYLGRNNIYFKKDPKTKQLTLYISDDGTTYPFKPSALESRKDDVIKSLQTLYMNINNHMINEIDESYEEILDIKDDGEIVSKKWDNYQTYLLSKKGRTADEIPLYTWMKPITGEGDTNRHSIYFIVEDETVIIPDYDKVKKKTVAFIKPKKAQKEEEFPEEEEEEEEGIRSEEKSKAIARKMVKKAIAKEIVKQRKSAPAKEENDKEKFTLEELEETPVTTYVLDYDKEKNIGTPQIFTTKEGRKVRFVAMPNADETNFMDTIGILPDKDVGQYAEIEKKFIEDGKKGKKKQVEKEEPEEEEKEELEEDIEEEEENAKNILNKFAKKVKKKKEDEDEDDEQTFTYDQLVDEDLRRQLEEQEEPVDIEDWDIVVAWLKKNFPNFPIYRLEHIIKTSTGIKAWGMLHKGAIYVFKHAEAGTVYHEVFEAIWKYLVPAEEQLSLYNEFKNREGSFFDVISKKTIKYSEANLKQAKERMAEELREYIHEKKIPVKPKSGRPFILKLFSDIVNFFKTFFVGPQADSNLEALFQKINKGHFKDAVINDREDIFSRKGIIDIEFADTEVTEAELKQIEKLNTEKDKKIKAVGKSDLKIDFIDRKKIVGSGNAREINKLQNELKKRYEKLSEMLKCL